MSRAKRTAMSQRSMIERFLRLSPVMPVVTIEDHDLACGFARDD